MAWRCRPAPTSRRGSTARWPSWDKRLPFDPAKARALLAGAGYPNGFSVTLDCVNITWREAVCQAMTAMLTQVGIRTTLRSSPTNQFFPKLTQAGPPGLRSATPTVDAWGSLNGLFHTYDKAGLGTFNAGRYSNPKLDVLIDAMRVEPDLTRRRAMVATVLRLVGEEMPVDPAVSPHPQLGDEEERAARCSGRTTRPSCAGCASCRDLLIPSAPLFRRRPTRHEHHRLFLSHRHPLRPGARKDVARTCASRA